MNIVKINAKNTKNKMNIVKINTKTTKNKIKMS